MVRLAGQRMLRGAEMFCMRSIMIAGIDQLLHYCMCIA
jgi:hypothetical protein